MIQPSPPQAAHAVMNRTAMSSTLAIARRVAGIAARSCYAAHRTAEMQILTVDVGTGTQDVLLYDSERELENCFKLVLPSPTVVAADRIRGATAQRKPLALQGVTM